MKRKDREDGLEGSDVIGRPLKRHRSKEEKEIGKTFWKLLSQKFSPEREKSMKDLIDNNPFLVNDFTSCNGNTALQGALGLKRTIALYLLEKGANYNFVSEKTGESVLQTALIYDLRIARILLDKEDIVIASNYRFFNINKKRMIPNGAIEVLSIMAKKSGKLAVSLLNKESFELLKNSEKAEEYKRWNPEDSSLENNSLAIGKLLEHISHPNQKAVKKWLEDHSNLKIRDLIDDKQETPLDHALSNLEKVDTQREKVQISRIIKYLIKSEAIDHNKFTADPGKYADLLSRLAKALSQSLESILDEGTIRLAKSNAVFMSRYEALNPTDPVFVNDGQNNEIAQPTRVESASEPNSSSKGLSTELSILQQSVLKSDLDSVKNWLKETSKTGVSMKSSEVLNISLNLLQQSIKNKNFNGNQLMISIHLIKSGIIPSEKFCENPTKYANLFHNIIRIYNITTKSDKKLSLKVLLDKDTFELAKGNEAFKSIYRTFDPDDSLFTQEDIGQTANNTMELSEEQRDISSKSSTAKDTSVNQRDIFEIPKHQISAEVSDQVRREEVGMYNAVNKDTGDQAEGPSVFTRYPGISDNRPSFDLTPQHSLPHYPGIIGGGSTLIEEILKMSTLGVGAPGSDVGDDY